MSSAMKNSTLTSLWVTGCICASTLLGTNIARAQIVVYTDLPTFTSNLNATGDYNQDFENLGTGAVPSPLNLSGGTPVFSYHIDAESSGSMFIDTVGTTPPSRALNTFLNNLSLTITFDSHNVTAVGGNFFLTDPFNLVNGSLTVTATDNLGHNVNPTATTSISSPVPFLGFTAAQGTFITSLVISSSSASGSFSTIDNLLVGTAVPEPSQWGVCFGVLGLAFAGVRRWRMAGGRCGA